jgi:hypothetical protein
LRDGKRRGHDKGGRPRPAKTPEIVVQSYDLSELALRLYWPDQAALNGTWVAPPVTRVN